MVEVHIAQYLLICQRHLNKIMILLNTMMLNILFFCSVLVYSKKKANVPMSTSANCLCTQTQCHQLVSLFSGNYFSLN